MTEQIDRLYDLLPMIHRRRDAEQGWPLRALLGVIAEQVNLIEADIDRLYDNWFIETCEEWLVPYVGDLVGYRPVPEAGHPGDTATPEDRARNRVLTPRAEVANTVNFRRRKGALYLLELLAAGVAGWPARAVEFYPLLAMTQALNHPWPARGALVDLRHGSPLDLLGGPFDSLAHTIDVRRPNSTRSPGRYNIPGIGLFVWRLKTYSVTKTRAYCLENVHDRCFSFSALGNDAPLYTRHVAETDPTTIAGEMNLPAPIRRRALELRPAPRVREAGANPAYYGEDESGLPRSLVIYAPGWSGLGDEPVPAARIKPADLSDWRYIPPVDCIAVDPVLGRLAFHPRRLPPKRNKRKGVWVSYHYGFSEDIGGGEYERPLSQPPGAVVYRVAQDGGHPWDSLEAALAHWESATPPPPAAVIEIQDSAVYVKPIAIRFAAEGQRLQIRAANGRRPVLRLLDWQPDQPDAVYVEGRAGSRLTLDGLLIAGRGIQVEGPMARLTIRHSTLVPGWWLTADCDPRRPNEPSVELTNTDACLIVEHSIIGSIIVNLDEVSGDPLAICIEDSILDATADSREAISAPGCRLAHAALTMRRTTVIGETLIHAIELAENSIFTGEIRVARRQIGCLRFSYAPPGSRTPRRFRCQPDLAEAAARARHEPANAPPVIIEAEQARIRPQFDSVRYGTPDYGRLAQTCAEEIVRGADDDSEMGVFHNLYQPQRAANLRARLEEFSPSGMDAGIIFAS